MKAERMKRPQIETVAGLWLLLAAFATAALTAACGVEGPAQQATVPPGATALPTVSAGTPWPDLERPFLMTLSVSHLPKLNEPFTVSATISPAHQDEEDAEIWIEISGGAYLAGEDRWHGPLAQGEVKAVEATFVILSEGNHEISAAGFANRATGPFPGNFQRALPTINMNVTAAESRWGLVPGTPYAPESGDIPAGHWIVNEAFLLLNTQAEPRLEFLTSDNDIDLLQRQGLLPSELRYQWRRLTWIDFSKQFLMLYVAPKTASPGHSMEIKDNSFAWHDDGVLSGTIVERAFTDEQPTSERLYSPALVQVLSWRDTPFGFEFPAFTSARRFDIALDHERDRGSVSITRQVDLRPGPPPTPTPVPPPLPGPAYSGLRLLLSDSSSSSVRWNGTVDVGVRVFVRGREQEIAAAQVGIKFNPAHLEAVMVIRDPGSPLTQASGETMIDNNKGLIYFKVEAGTGDSPRTDFTLARITFRAREVAGGIDTEITGIDRADELASQIESRNVAPRSGELPPEFLGVGDLTVSIEES
jgi:hypothetical protein